jgi:uncharacterized membrane protein
MTPASDNSDHPLRTARGSRKSVARLRWRRALRYIKTKLAWNYLYRAMSYLRSALWVVPLIAIVLVAAVMPTLRFLDGLADWNLLGLAREGEQAMFQTVITLTLSFLVFTFGSLLVAIQIAGGQLTPRIIATTLLRDNVVRYSVGLFVFSLVFAVSALNRLNTATGHHFVAFATAVLGVACMAAFLFLIDYAARLLRPVSVVARVADEALAVIESVYPLPATAAHDIDDVPRQPSGSPGRVVRHEGSSATVLAVDVATLVDKARRAQGLIEFIPQVGDFVASGEPLFALHGGATVLDDRRLRATVAVGSERTMEQDPLFGFRILVDIALKALSPAINDPTTAVIAIDQIHRLLRSVGKRNLRDEDITDDSGLRRVILRTPNWENFVHLACTEIRGCGAGNVQVARRLRAMLENLIQTVLPRRQLALKAELSALDRMVEKLYSLPEDLTLARIADSQGLGAASAGEPTQRTQL